MRVVLGVVEEADWPSQDGGADEHWAGRRKGREGNEEVVLGAQ